MRDKEKLVRYKFKYQQNKKIRGDIGVGILLILFFISAFTVYIANYANVFNNEGDITNASIFKNKAKHFAYTLSDEILELNKNENTNSPLKIIGTLIPDNETQPSWSKYFVKIGKSKKLYVPPSDKHGMPKSFQHILGKDPWGNKVTYYSWDLRTETPPVNGLIMRFVSPGNDGVIQTKKQDKTCQGDDVCYDITNDGLSNTINAVVLNTTASSPSTGNSNGGNATVDNDTLSSTPNPLVIFIDTTQQTLKGVGEITIKNTSSSDVTITSVESSSINNWSVTAKGECIGITLSPSQSCTLDVVSSNTSSSNDTNTVNFYLLIKFSKGEVKGCTFKVPARLQFCTKYFCGGDGTENNPYIIANIKQLQNLGEWETSHDANHKYYYFKLGSDIDASVTKDWNSGKGFIPISNFTGSFDGGGHTISGLYINDSNDNCVALFTSLSGKADIKNLVIEKANVTTGDRYGAVLLGCVGGKQATIDHVFIIGSYLKGCFSGQFVGEGQGTLTITNSGNINGTVSESCWSCNGSAIVGHISKSNTLLSKDFVYGFKGGTGFLDWMYGVSSSFTITDSYVFGSALKDGGFICHIDNANANIYRSYVYKSTYSKPIMSSATKYAYGHSSSFYIDGQLSSTTEQFLKVTQSQALQASTYSGWDFDKVWNKPDASKQIPPTLRGLLYQNDVHF